MTGLAARMVGTSLEDDSPVLAVSLLEDVLLQSVFGTGIALPVEQEPAELVGPYFTRVPGEELQFAQQVLVAEGVESLVFEVGLPEVVDEPGAALAPLVSILRRCPDEYTRF